MESPTSAYLTAVFNNTDVPADDKWRDQSTADMYVFLSDFGAIRLRKRLDYPATFASVSGAVLHFGYGLAESVLRIFNQDLQQVPEAAFYNDEFLYVTADCRTRTVTIQRDALSTLPIFLYANNHELRLSNHFDDIYNSVSADKLSLNPYALSMLLTGSASGETLFNEIQTLHDRMRLIWEPGSVRRQYAPDGGIHQLVRSRQGDATGFFKQLESTLESYRQRYAASAPVGIELSCGMDSSAIAGYLARVNQPHHMVSLTYHGAYRQSIRERLAAFNRQFGTTSHEIPMEPELDYPLSHRLTDGQVDAFYTEEEIYAPSLQKAASYLASLGVTSVFRGIGGDELLENKPALASENPSNPLLPDNFSIPPYLAPSFADYAAEAGLQSQRKPLPLLAQSVITAVTSANNVYIDQGIWPVLPLADARLYLYCQSLPIRYRYGRNVLRAYLHARQYPEVIYNPERNEDFGHFFNAAVTMNLGPLLGSLLQNSVVADMGLLDTNRALNAWLAATAGPPDKPSDDLYKLFCLIKAEINLQHWRARKTSANRKILV